MSLTGSLQISGNATYTSPLDLSTPLDKVAIGTRGFDDIIASITNGTGSGQANQHWHDERTVLTANNDNLDLAGGLTSSFGATITFTKIKAIVIAIDTPASGKVLKVGPQNIAAAAQLWFGGTGATVYETIYDALARWSLIDGWTVTATTADIFGIRNDSGVSITYRIWILGTV
jgi:hypothetical protein